MSIATVFSGAGRWLHTNLVGNGPAAKDFLNPDDGSKQRQDLEKIEQGIEQWEKDLSQIDKDVQVHPPKLADLSNKDIVALGAGGGAVAGTALGLLSGTAAVWWDDPQIKVTHQTLPINQPVLDAKHPYSDAFHVENGDNWHRFAPNIGQQKIGEYKVPHGAVSHSANGNVASNALQGLVWGTAVGVGAGLAVAAARHYMGQDQNVKEAHQVDGQGKVIAAGAAGGAAVGGALGLLSGWMESGHHDSQTLKWDVPVMQPKEIGNIPVDHIHSRFGTVREALVGQRPVSVDSPVMEKGIFGTHPQMHEQSQVVSYGPRFGVAGQMAGGMVLGAVGGATAGVMVNILRKYI